MVGENGLVTIAGGKLTTYRRMVAEVVDTAVNVLRALVGLWLFAGCRIDEIRRLELDCIRACSEFGSAVSWFVRPRSAVAW